MTNDVRANIRWTDRKEQREAAGWNSRGGVGDPASACRRHPHGAVRRRDEDRHQFHPDRPAHHAGDGADGAFIPFPDDFYARQNTTLRSSNRMVYLDSDFNAPNTRMMKSIGPVEFPTVYFGGGPPQKFMVHGNTRTVDWATGQPKTDADYIVCAFIQVVYGGVNLTSPTACAQTTYP